MSFTYTRDIPFSTHNPSNDQPNMLINNNSIDDLIAVDHVTFNSADSGKHNTLTFVNSATTPALPVSQTQVYPQTFGSGTSYLETFAAISTSASTQINGYLPLVKALFTFTTQAGPYPKTLYPSGPANTLFVNIATIVQNPANVVTVTFATPLPYNTYYLFTDIATAAFNVTITRNTNNIIFSGLSITARPFSLMVI